MLTLAQCALVVALSFGSACAVYWIATRILTPRLPDLTDDFHAGRGAGDEAEG